MNYSSQNEINAYAAAAPHHDRFVENVISSISRAAGVVVLFASFVGVAVLILN
jgi:hypothetical protein